MDFVMGIRCLLLQIGLHSARFCNAKRIMHIKAFFKTTSQFFILICYSNAFQFDSS